MEKKLLLMTGLDVNVNCFILGYLVFLVIVPLINICLSAFFCGK